MEVLGILGGGAGDLFLDDLLLGGRDEVAEEGAIVGSVGAVEEVADFAVVLGADPFARGAFVLQVFDGSEEALWFPGEELLGEDTNEVHGEKVQGTLASGGLEDVDEAGPAFESGCEE